MMDQIEGDDMFKCYVELKKYPPHQNLPPLPLPLLSLWLRYKTGSEHQACVVLDPLNLL